MGELLVNTKVKNAQSIQLSEIKGSKTGIIFDIKRFAVHDGPGIRTTVFFKGCPLSCQWCHNPEGQGIAAEIIFWENRCIRCYTCAQICPNGAISYSDGYLFTDREKCALCGDCSAVCPSSARVIIGRKVTMAEVMEEVEKDIIFYDESCGGVTFSGGEPLMQPDFLNSLLLYCKEKKIHTAVDTCGYAERDTLLKISKNVDLFLYDLKLMDNNRHKRFTGESNELILNNLKELALHHNQIIVRVPIIPDINDDDENIFKIGEFLVSLKAVMQIDLLPYNKLSIDKHNRLKRAYSLSKIQPPSAEGISEIKEKLTRFGLRVQIRR